MRRLIGCGGECVVRKCDHNIASRSASLPTNGAQLGSSMWLVAHMCTHTLSHDIAPTLSSSPAYAHPQFV